VGRESSGGIANLYGLDGPVIESRWRARFSSPVQTGPGASPTSYTMVPCLFLEVGKEVKWEGRGVNNPPHLTPRLKKGYSYTSIPPLGLLGMF